MKLRILNNSVRFRLSQSEVKELAANGIVAASTSFGPTEFTYQLKTTTDSEFTASFENHALSVFIPAKQAEFWSSTDEISLQGQQLITSGEFLQILVEKDFKCLSDRPNEDEADLFPNPKLSC